MHYYILIIIHIQTFLARGDQLWLPKSVWGAKFGPCIMISGGTVFGKGGPILAAKISPGRLILAAKIGLGDHFFSQKLVRGDHFMGKQILV